MAGEQLSRFLGTGAALPAALRAVARDISVGGFREALREAASDVEAGTTLSDALAKRPDQFPPLFRFIVEAGTAAGRLGPALLLVSEYYGTTARLRHRFIENAIYPAILVLAMVALSLEAAFMVVPRFQRLYSDFGTTLPLPTRLAFYAIRYAGEWLPWAGGAAVACLLVLLAFTRVKPLRYVMDRALFLVPVIGGLLRSFVVAKLAGGIALLVESGVPAPRALRLMADVEPNLWVRRAMNAFADRTEQGTSVAEAFARGPAGLLPSTFQWVIASAQDSNSLARGAKRLSTLYGEMAKRRFMAIETLIGPVIVVVLGVLTLFVAGMLLLPLLDALHMLT